MALLKAFPRRGAKRPGVLYSVVSPVYGGAGCLAALRGRLEHVFRELGCEFELILVDDGSDDDTWRTIVALCAQDPRVRGIRLVRNFGQHPATLCGLSRAGGERVITMDSDLQHPPEEIPWLIRCLEEGHEAVIGRFPRKRHAWYKNLGSRFKHLLERWIFDVPEGLTMSGFRLLSGSVARELGRVTDFSPYLPAYLYQVCSRMVNLDVDHRPRAEGVSQYGWTRSLKFLVNMVFNAVRAANGFRLRSRLRGREAYVVAEECGFSTSSQGPYAI